MNLVFSDNFPMIGEFILDNYHFNYLVNSLVNFLHFTVESFDSNIKLSLESLTLVRNRFLINLLKVNKIWRIYV